MRNLYIRRRIPIAVTTLGAGVSLAAAVISALFTIAVLGRFFETRKPHNLMWSVGLGMFMVVALVQFFAEMTGWTDRLFKSWYVMGTALVGFLGSGSVYIVHRKIGHAFGAFVLLMLVAFVAAAAVSATDPAALATFTAGAPPDPAGWADTTPRRFSPLFTIPGSMALIGIALVGLVRYRLMYNLPIAGGAVVLAVGTGLARLGIPSLIYAAEFAGIAIMFFGFLKAIEWAKERAKGTPMPPMPSETETTVPAALSAPK